jgi:hypothetical protein
MRLPVVYDTWIAGLASEADYNLGGSARLKLKSCQEMSLLDINPAALRGRVVQAALIP